MKILALVNMVPDIVEELAIAPSGRELDPASVRMILSERDDHALEEAVLLKERHGGTVTVVALDAPAVDEALFTALARGADHAIKITGVTRPPVRGAASVLASQIRDHPALQAADLILTGAQAIDDLDGQLAPLLADCLALPYVGVVTQVQVDPSARTASVLREFAGGVRGRFVLPLPAVLGIQSAEKPPRYTPVGKVRAAMKSQRIESVSAPAPSAPALADVRQMRIPEAAARATMLEGTPEAIAAQLCDLLAARGLV